MTTLTTSTRVTAFQFVVWSVPVAQPRQRHTIFAGHVKSYTPTKAPVNVFKAAVQMALQENHGNNPPLDGPLHLAVEFFLPRPKSLIWKSRPMPQLPHATRPDIDNLLKSVMDAMKGMAWRDDTQVSEVVASKYICGGDDRPHVRIFIREA